MAQRPAQPKQQGKVQRVQQNASQPGQPNRQVIVQQLPPQVIIQRVQQVASQPGQPNRQVIVQQLPTQVTVHRIQQNAPQPATQNRQQNAPQTTNAAQGQSRGSLKIDPNYEAESLKYHNQYRSLHGCPPLKINDVLTKLAQDWAQHLARHDKMEHRDNNKYGENIYVCGGMDITGEQPIKMWYSEIAQYDFAKSQFTPNTGHFTQLIWRDTKEVGVGISKKADKTFVVANYNPPGNVVGKFRENVPPKK